eukprot:COSAG01_NODE_7193_length_3309_cov_49.141745_3_plen_105_part_00
MGSDCVRALRTAPPSKPQSVAAVTIAAARLLIWPCIATAYDSYHRLLRQPMIAIIGCCDDTTTHRGSKLLAKPWRTSRNDYTLLRATAETITTTRREVIPQRNI